MATKLFKTKKLAEEYISENYPPPKWAQVPTPAAIPISPRSQIMRQTW